VREEDLSIKVEEEVVLGGVEVRHLEGLQVEHGGQRVAAHVGVI
jgi:hypothetical protein